MSKQYGFFAPANVLNGASSVFNLDREVQFFYYFIVIIPGVMINSVLALFRVDC
jgi:hypothetical protein